jgi:hypothetical protein
MAQPGGTSGKPPTITAVGIFMWRKQMRERIGDTVELFPQHGTMPTLSSSDTAIKAAIQLTDALQNPHLAGPFAPLDTSTLSALEHLSELFSSKISKPVANQPTTTPPRVAPEPPTPPRVPQSPAIPLRAPHRYPTCSSHRALAVQAMVLNDCIRFSAAQRGVTPPPLTPPPTPPCLTPSWTPRRANSWNTGT